MDLPPPLAARARWARRIVEVGAGTRFDLALALKAAAPHAEVVVTDVDPRVMLAPLGLRAALWDVHAPAPPEVEGADLLVAIRVPEELQLACARQARALGADLALRPLKDEWADVGAAFRRHEAWPAGWRYFAIDGATRTP